MLSRSPFLKAVFDALEDEIDQMDFEKISLKYTAKSREVEKVKKNLEALPEMIETEAGPVNVRELIGDLDELQEQLFGIGFDIAIKQGFSTAFKLIFYSLTLK